MAKNTKIIRMIKCDVCGKKVKKGFYGRYCSMRCYSNAKMLMQK